MNALRLLIADGTEEFRNDLADKLRSTYQICTSGEGQEALRLLRGFSPDILVLDLMLPGLDGLSLLQQAEMEGYRMKILATTRFFSDYILESVRRLGVGYLMIKPCDVKAVVMRLADLTAPLKTVPTMRPEPRALVTNQLLRLGVPTKLRGYGCLREAVLLMAKNPSQSITKELYPAVADWYSGNPQQVERSIRNAICAAWSKRDEKVWSQYFPPEADGHIPKPTNAAFISRLADFLFIEAGPNAAG